MSEGLTIKTIKPLTSTFEELFDELSQDPEFRAEYDKLERAINKTIRELPIKAKYTPDKYRHYQRPQ